MGNGGRNGHSGSYVSISCSGCSSAISGSFSVVVVV